MCPKCGLEMEEASAYCANCGSQLALTLSQARGYPQAVELGYAGFWKRVAARIIDGVILGVVIFAIALVILYGLGWGAVLANRTFGIAGEPESVMGAIMLSTWTVGLTLNWLYFTLLESSGRQATVGKMALGIVVTDLDGVRITFGRANARFWSQVLLGLIWLALAIGYIMAGFTQRKQALHDLMAGTLVVNRDYRL